MSSSQFQLNASEKEIIRYFEEFFNESGKQDIFQYIPVHVRKQALNHFLDSGLSTRNVEEWHYTDLRNRLTRVPVQQASFEKTADLGKENDRLLKHGSVTPTITGLDEKDTFFHTSYGALDCSEFGLPDVDQDFSKKLDILSLLNNMLVNEGVFLSINKSTREPIEFFYELSDFFNKKASEHNSVQLHLQNRIDVGSNIKAKMVWRAAYSSSEGINAHLSTTVTKIKLGEGCDFTMVIDTDLGAHATILSRYSFVLEKNSKLTCILINSGNYTARNEIEAKFVGEGANANFLGVSLTRGKQVSDIRVEVEHLVENTFSNEKFRSVTDEEGYSIFQGLIKVAPGAQKTDARLMTNALLLSDKARSSAKPELEIFADDVQCGHGSTLGQINKEALFYLMARGIDRKQAMGLLIRAFIAELIEELNDEHLIKILTEKTDKWIESISNSDDLMITCV